MFLLRAKLMSSSYIIITKSTNRLCILYRIPFLNQLNDLVSTVLTLFGIFALLNALKDGEFLSHVSKV